MKVLKSSVSIQKAKPVVNPYGAIGVGILCISFGSILAKLSTAPSLIIATYRLFFTALLLTPWVLWKNRQDFQSLDWASFGRAGLSGVFLALHFATWISSLKYINVSSSVVLVALQPVFVALGSLLVLKETIPLKALLSGALALSGTFIIGAESLQLGKQALLGDILAITGALFAALYWMTGRVVRQKLSVTAYTYIAYSSCALLLLLFTLFQGLPLFAYPPREWLLFVASALVPTLGGHSIFNWALGYVKSLVVSVAILGEAVGASILAFFILGEVPGTLELVGGLIILLGLYLFLINNKTNEEE